MRIAVWHNLGSGGGKRALYDHIKGLIERGHTVVSYCPDTVDQSYLPISNLTEEKIFPLRAKLKKRVRAFKYLNSPDLVKEKLKAELEHCAECAEDINANNFDLLFANSSSFFAMSHISRFVNIPKLIYLGEPYRPLYESGSDFIWRAPDNTNISSVKYFLKRTKQLYRMFWYSKVVRDEYISASSYDLILVNSLFSRESIKRVYNLESKVCYLGIDTNKFSPGQFEKERVVIGLGAISRLKGIEQSILSLSMIDQASRPPLIWIGNSKLSEYSDFLLEYAKELGVEIIFKPNVSDDELLSTLSKACVLLYFPRLEPFGLAPLEANACGTAVISIKEGGVRETITHGVNGFVANDFNPAEIAEYVKVISNDLAYAKLMGEKSREHILNNWNLAKGIDNIETIMLELVKHKSLK